MDVQGLVDVLARMAPPGVATGARLISSADLALLGDAERDQVASSVAVRQHEFATGRALLHELVGTTEPILIGPSRAPLWPAGVTGSLAHDRSVAVAAVSRLSTVGAIGIDVEPTDRLSADMARVILRDDERDMDAHLAFALKEATYKAWSSSGGAMLEHHDMRLALARDESGQAPGRRFTATVVGDGTIFEGRWAVVEARFVVLVVAVAARESR